MKTEFKKLIRRLSFFMLSTRHQNCLDKSLIKQAKISVQSGVAVLPTDPNSMQKTSNALNY